MEIDPKRVGFMLGRFSPIEPGKIQSFPRDTWRDEFAISKKCGFGLMEWVVEQDRLSDNPLMSEGGRREMKKHMKDNAIVIASITCDTYIQEPFYKAERQRSAQLLKEFMDIVEACTEIGINKIVVPLVDRGSLEDSQQEERLRAGMDTVHQLLKDNGLTIAFESDYEPFLFKKFINKFDPVCFGINYDIGNSASLGYDFREEILTYGNRISNVHIKDRKLNGTTVPLGEGDADIAGVLKALNDVGYSGNYILQTARAADGDHAGALCRYRGMILQGGKYDSDE